ncbi:MAG: hypothetical protein JWO67_1784 [Streptosporangiaceae bacterium]|nr:hypothetical protein [Streptosporangiaceae bacterium]
MNPAGWYTGALMSLYAASMLTAVSANAVCSWRAGSLSNLAVALQVVTGVLGILLGLLYGSPPVSRLVDGLAGISGLHIPLRESLFVIGVVCIQSFTALWSHRRFPAAHIYSSCAIGTVLLAALVVTSLQSHQRGQPFGVQTARTRYDVAAYYLALYAYITHTAARLVHLGRQSAGRLARRRPDTTEDEVLAARGMWLIAVSGSLTIGFVAAHLVVMVSLFTGSPFAQGIFDAGTVCYVVSVLAYVIGICYPAPAKAWAERKHRRPRCRADPAGAKGCLVPRQRRPPNS